MTQEELAEKMGVSRQTISKWELDATYPEMDEELVIALPQYTLDMNEARNSIKKLLNYYIDRIICYHGGIYTKDIKETLKGI